MKKKNKALLTLALAGTIALSGAGGLYVSMAKTMQEESTTQDLTPSAWVLALPWHLPSSVQSVS